LSGIEPRPGKILLVRFSALGDVIQTLPILTLLRDSFPEAKIGWAIDTELAPAIEGHPALDYIHRCSRRSWSQMLSNPAKWPLAMRGFQAFVDEVRAVRYDVAIDAQGLFKTALLPYLAGIRRRIGYQHGREFSSAFYTERYIDRKEYFDPAVCHLDHMAELAGSIGSYAPERAPGLRSGPASTARSGELGAANLSYAVAPPRVSENARKRVGELLEGSFAQPAPLVVITPATQWASKSWPEDYWVALISLLLAETDLHLILQGSAADAPAGARILGNFLPAQLAGRVGNLFGKLPIPEMYALYECAQAAIGPDSAPLHIAGAMGVPVLLGIYGPTGYRRTPPIGSPHIKLFSTEGELECQPCHKRSCPLGTNECMKRVRPEEVFQVLLDGLSEAGISFQNKKVAMVR
jgi:lipopolysaccharide heptosyltransferase II